MALWARSARGCMCCGCRFARAGAWRQGDQVRLLVGHPVPALWSAVARDRGLRGCSKTARPASGPTWPCRLANEAAPFCGSMYAHATSAGRLALCQMSTFVEMSWNHVAAALALWHDCQDRSAGRAALVFLESEFRAMVPTVVRRTWPPDLVEDTLRDLLRRLLERRCVPPDLHSPRGYFRNMLRNAFIEEHRQRQHRPDDLLAERDVGPDQIEDIAPGQFNQVADNERSTILRAALTQLSLPDRVALKLEHDPDWLDAEEAAWLAARNGCSVDEVVERASAVRDMYEITLLFDPSDDGPSDPQARRKRMERFRKRRDRARDQLLALLKGKIE